MANIDMKVTTFDDGGDTLTARAFLRDVEDAIMTGDLNDKEGAGLLRKQLRGTPREWMDLQIARGKEGFDKFSTLRPLFEARYCRPLTAAQLRSLEGTLVQKDKEKANAFMVRIERYLLEDDRDVEEDVKKTDAYKKAFDRRARTESA